MSQSKVFGSLLANISKNNENVMQRYFDKTCRINLKYCLLNCIKNFMLLESERKKLEIKLKVIRFPCGSQNFNFSEMLVFVINFPKAVISKVLTIYSDETFSTTLFQIIFLTKKFIKFISSINAGNYVFFLIYVFFFFLITRYTESRFYLLNQKVLFKILDMGYYVEHHNDELIIILIVKLPKSL